MIKLLCKIFLITSSLFFIPQTFSQTACSSINSEATLNNCLSYVASHPVATITATVTGSISCDSDCQFTILNFHGNLTIRGTSQAISIRRKFPDANQTCGTSSIFNISNSSGVVIENLTLGWDGDQLGSYWNTDKPTYIDKITVEQNIPSSVVALKCPSYTAVNIGENTTSVTLNNLNISTRQAHAIDLGGVGIAGITISNSIISNAYYFGIWTSDIGAAIVNGVAIRHNQFLNMGSNAIILSNAQNIQISENTFNGNHQGQLFGPKCDPVPTPIKLSVLHEKCPGFGGGQIDLNNSVNHILIDNNVIFTTREQNFVPTSGIEFGAGYSGLTNDVQIYNNIIYNNPFGAIHFGEVLNPTSIKAVLIHNNTFYENLPEGSNVNNHKNIYVTHNDVAIYDNFYSSNITLSPTANFLDTAKNCELKNNPTCSVLVKWSSTSTNNVEVKVDGNGLFSTNKNSSQIAPWISAGGDVFEIHSLSGVVSPTEPIARYYIKGI